MTSVLKYGSLATVTYIAAVLSSPLFAEMALDVRERSGHERASVEAIDTQTPDGSTENQRAAFGLARAFNEIDHPTRDLSGNRAIGTACLI